MNTTTRTPISILGTDDSAVVPRGYKRTEVGIIPTDWEVSPLGLLVRSVEYGSSAKSDTKGSIPVLRMGNLQDGKIDWSDLVYTDRAAEIRKYFLRAGDVLFNRTNTIELVGKTSIYEGEQPAIFAGYLIRVNVIPELLDTRFLNYVLNTDFAHKHSIKVLSVAVGQANINGQKLKTYPIPMPPTKAEQRAIAEALSDVDGLIGALDKLIAKKRAIKLATMQQLLTGKKRLPGFENHRGHAFSDFGPLPKDWECKHLGDDGLVIRVGSGITPTGGQRVYKDEGRPFVRSQNIGWGHLILDDLARIDDDTHATFSTSEIVSGDVLLNITGASIGRSAVADAQIHGGNVNQHVCEIRTDHTRLDPQFLCSVLLSHPGQRQIDSFQAGGNRQGLNFGQIRSFVIPLPIPEEQRAIATVLSDMDAEIASLERRRNKTKAIKQGMMQQLLTGRIRLLKQ